MPAFFLKWLCQLSPSVSSTLAVSEQWHSVIPLVIKVGKVPLPTADARLRHILLPSCRSLLCNNNLYRFVEIRLSWDGQSKRRKGTKRRNYNNATRQKRIDNLKSLFQQPCVQFPQQPNYLPSANTLPPPFALYPLQTIDSASTTRTTFENSAHRRLYHQPKASIYSNRLE